MKKIIAFIVLSFCCVSLQAQNSNAEKASSKKVEYKSLNQVYAAKVLDAYQENSKTKVEDLFYYFQLLTDASLTDDLKKEVVKSIKQLYRSQNVEVIDFTTQSLDKILLDMLIQKLLISEPMLFSVASQSKYDSVDYQSWKINYSITKTKSGIQNKIEVTQKVYFIEVPKQFGDAKKEVTETFFGAMEYNL